MSFIKELEFNIKNTTAFTLVPQKIIIARTNYVENLQKSNEKVKDKNIGEILYTLKRKFNIFSISVLYNLIYRFNIILKHDL